MLRRSALHLESVQTREIAAFHASQSARRMGDVKKQLPRSPLDEFPQIIVVRSQRVMLDETLAELYGVPTKVFNQAVRRNRERFPPDFLLEIDDKEWEILRSQIVTLRSGHGQHRKYLPLAFTEHGAIMAATILNSPRSPRWPRQHSQARGADPVRPLRASSV